MSRLVQPMKRCQFYENCVTLIDRRNKLLRTTLDFVSRANYPHLHAAIAAIKHEARLPVQPGEVVQVARSVDTQCSASAPVLRRTLVPSYLTWFYAPSVIALESACLASQWFSSVMTIGWAPMLPAAGTSEPNGDSVVEQSHRIIVTPGSNVIRVIPAANAQSVAPKANTDGGLSEILCVEPVD